MKTLRARAMELEHCRLQTITGTVQTIEIDNR